MKGDLEKNALLAAQQDVLPITNDAPPPTIRRRTPVWRRAFKYIVLFYVFATVHVLFKRAHRLDDGESLSGAHDWALDEIAFRAQQGVAGKEAEELYLYVQHSPAQSSIQP